MSVLQIASRAPAGPPEEALLFRYLPDAGVSGTTENDFPDPNATFANQTRGAGQAASHANQMFLFLSFSISTICERARKPLPLRRTGDRGARAGASAQAVLFGWLSPACASVAARWKHRSTQNRLSSRFSDQPITPFAKKTAGADTLREISFALIGPHFHCLQVERCMFLGSPRSTTYGNGWVW